MCKTLLSPKKVF